MVTRIEGFCKTPLWLPYDGNLNRIEGFCKNPVWFPYDGNLKSLNKNAGELQKAAGALGLPLQDRFQGLMGLRV